MKQKEYIGPGSINMLSEIIKKENVSNVFLVCGKESFKKSGAKEKLNNIPQIKEYTVYNDFSNNPKYDDLIRGIEEFQKEEFDIILAIGGGSSIDMAKLIKMFAFQKYDIEKNILKSLKFHGINTPLCAIPTTAGTGSESTHFAVLYIEGIKYSVANINILPDYIILDSALTLSLTPYYTASSGMDALCQCIESLWSVNSTNSSKKIAESGLKLILDNIDKAVNNPDLQTRSNMLIGANYSGKAINTSKTTAPHAFSYIVTSMCGIPHGHAVALFLGEILLYNSKIGKNRVVDPRGEEYLKTIMLKINRYIGSCNSFESKKIFLSLMNKIGLEVKLSKLCEKVDLDKLIEGVNQERLKNNPVIIDKNNIKDIFCNIY